HQRVGGGQALAAALFAVVTAIIFALAPRLTIGVGWAIVAAAASLALFGTILGLDDGVVALSPFAAIPTPTPDGVDVNGLAWLVVAVVAGAAASIALMFRRELAAGG
ncbi:MAG: polyketide antibiotic transporter, partial [Microbacterium sp.]